MSHDLLDGVEVCPSPKLAHHDQKVMTQQKDGSPGLALVKLDFSTGMNRGSDASSQNQRQPQGPKSKPEAELSPMRSRL